MVGDPRINPVVNDFPIIVIGLSAGGIRPLLNLVDGLPRDFQADLFVVVHSSSRRLVLDGVLHAQTGLPTRMARDLERFEQGHAYVCPGDVYLSIENGMMRVEDRPKESLYRPSINALCRSAAQAYRRRVIGVLLSGLSGVLCQSNSRIRDAVSPSPCGQFGG